jgi:hypothetical protein
MSSEAITASTFIREYTRELHNKNAAIFAGAGLSMDSGYVDWPGLLRELIQDLGLDPEKEHDLVTLAQYHCNQAGGSKTRLTQAIFTHFAPTRTPTKNHQILARLPIYTYWTTNYVSVVFWPSVQGEDGEVKLFLWWCSAEEELVWKMAWSLPVIDPASADTGLWKRSGGWSRRRYPLRHRSPYWPVSMV